MTGSALNGGSDTPVAVRLVAAIERWVRRTFGRRFTPPRELLDPEGEGIYLLDPLWENGASIIPGVLRRAAWVLLGDSREWRNIEVDPVWMWPSEDDCFYPANIGRFPRGWRLNLPPRWRPVAYDYCTPKAEA